MSEPAGWEAGPPPRRIARAAALASLVAAALVVGMLFGGDGIQPTTPDLVVEEAPAPSASPARIPSQPPLLGGDWDRVRVGPLAGRSRATAVWTGTEVMVWGGAGFQPFADGALYNPATDRWRRVAPSPLRPRVRPAGVWNGREVVIVGGGVFVQRRGTAVTLREQRRRDGAAYDPASRTWRAIPPLPFPVRAGRVFARDGRLYAVSDTARARPLAVLDRGAAFWRTPKGPPGWQRSGGIAAARVGDGLLLLWPPGSGDAVSFDLSAQRWTTISQANQPLIPPECACTVAAGVFTRGAVDVVVYEADSRRWSRFEARTLSPSDAVAAPRFTVLVEGSLRAIVEGQVLDLPTTPQGLGRDPAVVWAGDRLFAWGGIRTLRGLFTSDGLTFTPG